MATFYSYGQNSWEAAVTYTTSFNASTGKSTLSMTAFTMKKGSGTTADSTTSNTYFYIIINGTQYSIGKHTYKVPKGGTWGASESFSWSAEYTPGTTLQIAFDDPWNNLWAAVGSSAYASVTVAGYPTYTVSYAANGGTSTPASQTKTWGTNLTLRAGISHNNTTANGYTVTFDPNSGTVSPTTKTATDTTTYSFASWKASNGTTYGASGTYTANAATTMTAQWTTSTTKGSITTPTATRANGTATRTVTFDATTNGGTCSTSSLNSTAAITYTGNGWYTAASGGTKRCDNGGSYTPAATETVVQQWGSSTGSYGAITLPAATKANGSTSRTVTINANGGSTTVSSRTSTATITYSQTGWWTASSGGTNRGNSGATYTPAAAEKVYAQFSPSTGSYSAVTLPTASECTRTDYTLKGFATSSTATTATYSPGQSYTPSANVELFAVWEANQAKAWMKVNGTWVNGFVWFKQNGTWVAVKKIYTKENGTWKS